MATIVQHRASPTAAGEAGGAATKCSNSGQPPSAKRGRRLGAGASLGASCSMRTRGNAISGRHSLQCFVFGSRSVTHAEALGKRRQKPDRATHSRHRSWAVRGRSRTASLQRCVSLGTKTRLRLVLIPKVSSPPRKASMAGICGSLGTAVVRPPFPYQKKSDDRCDVYVSFNVGFHTCVVCLCSVSSSHMNDGDAPPIASAKHSKRERLIPVRSTDFVRRRHTHTISKISGQTPTTCRDGRPCLGDGKCTHETHKTHENNPRESEERTAANPQKKTKETKREAQLRSLIRFPELFNRGRGEPLEAPRSPR